MVLLAGGAGAGSWAGPLCSAEQPAALLPAGNLPQIAYSLDWVAAAGLTQALVLAGADVAPAITVWAASEYKGPVKVTVSAVPEDKGTCGALRHVRSQLTGVHLVVVSTELICDVPLASLLARHRTAKPVATVFLAHQRASLALEMKPGKPVKGAEYIGTDADRSQLCFMTDGSDVKEVLKVPRTILRYCGQMLLSTSLMDTRLYILHNCVLDILEAKPELASLQRDLIPYLTRQQFTRRPYATTADDSVEPPTPAAPVDEVLSQLQSVSLGTNAPGPAPDVTRQVAVYFAQPGSYVTRVSDIRSYTEANRELASAADAAHLNGAAMNTAHENFVHRTAEIGARSAVGPACMVGEDTKIAEKCSVKKSVLGRRCRLGPGTKIVNSVIHDDVVIEDGCQIQGSIVGRGAVLQAGSSLRECQVGPGMVIAAGVEHRSEALSKKH